MNTMPTGNDEDAMKSYAKTVVTAFKDGDIMEAEQAFNAMVFAATKEKIADRKIEIAKTFASPGKRQ